MTVKSKEIWVRFENMESYRENEKKLCTLLSETPGDCTAFVFINDVKNVRELYTYYFDEEKISLLEDAFGKENVRFREKGIHVRDDWEYRDIFEDLLERIADSLENISITLRRIYDDRA